MGQRRKMKQRRVRSRSRGRRHDPLSVGNQSRVVEETGEEVALEPQKGGLMDEAAKASRGQASGAFAPLTEGKADVAMANEELSTLLPCCPPIKGRVIHRLRPGARRRNYYSFLYMGMNNVSFLVFVSAIMPYSLDNFLFVPEAQQGQASGDASFWDELVVLLTAWFVGSLSDFVGRQWVTAVGAAIIGLAFFLFPFAQTLPVFFAIRCLFALGVSGTTSMMTTVVGDLVPQQQQGVGMGTLGLFTGIGALIAVLIYLRLPELAESALHFNVIQSGFFAYWVVSAVALVSCACVACFYQTRAVAKQHGLLGDKPALLPLPVPDDQERGPAEPAASAPPRRFFSTTPLLACWYAVKENPALLLAFATAFTARGDAMILTTFLSLWVTQVARGQGQTPSEASTRAGVVGGIAQTCAICFAGIAGLVYHKFGLRRNLLGLALLCSVGCLSYLFLGLVGDPTGSVGMLAAACAGAGEIGVVIGSQAFVAQESPQHVRGGLAGLFQFTGGLGIMLASKFGGWLFDKWTPGGPFLLFAIFNGLCAVFGIILYVMRACKTIK